MITKKIKIVVSIDPATTDKKILTNLLNSCINNTKKMVGDEKKVCVNYSMLPKEVRVGGWIMLHDGKKKLKIVKIKGKDVVCRVVVGG